MTPDLIKTLEVLEVKGITATLTKNDFIKLAVSLPQIISALKASEKLVFRIEAEGGHGFDVHGLAEAVKEALSSKKENGNV